jgi:hypothetical protein
MKLTVCLIVGVFLTSMCLADPSRPSETNLLSTINNLDIKADEWSITNGVLTKNFLLYQGDKLLVVKASVVEVPTWYVLTCSLTNVQKRSGVLPEAGLVFGYVDSKNYWSVTIGGKRTVPMLKLIQVAGGRVVTEKSVPFVMNDDQEEVQLRVEVHHQIWVKAYVNNSEKLIHNVAGGITQGRIGLALTSGACDFSRAKISGMAKH